MGSESDESPAKGKAVRVLSWPKAFTPCSLNAEERDILTDAIHILGTSTGAMLCACMDLSRTHSRLLAKTLEDRIAAIRRLGQLIQDADEVVLLAMVDDENPSDATVAAEIDVAQANVAAAVTADDAAADLAGTPAAVPTSDHSSCTCHTPAGGAVGLRAGGAA